MRVTIELPESVESRRTVNGSQLRIMQSVIEDAKNNCVKKATSATVTIRKHKMINTVFFNQERLLLYPEVMQEFNLVNNQRITEETFYKVLEANCIHGIAQCNAELKKEGK